MLGPAVAAAVAVAVALAVAVGAGDSVGSGLLAESHPARASDRASAVSRILMAANYSVDEAAPTGFFASGHNPDSRRSENAARSSASGPILA